MEAFRVHTGVAAPLDRADVDTDQIVPKQFLKRIDRAGYGQFLFHDWRFDETGAARPDFVLNRPEYEHATILLAQENFGCGSSREHAAWALEDYGFRAIIAPSFADIFQENADQNGILTVCLSEDRVAELMARAAEGAPYRLTVDLERCSVTDEGGFEASFEMDSFRRQCLSEGLDRIALTLRHEDKITAYEESTARARWIS